MEKITRTGKIREISLIRDCKEDTTKKMIKVKRVKKKLYLCSVSMYRKEMFFV
jgi:hypothetical protein